MTKMPEEYISREAAVKALFAPGMCYAPIQLQIVKDLPAADVAEVVRCKDCKYGDYDSKPNGAMVCLRTKDGFWREETDFCSYGKRREE
jgi:hypothetical protein